MTSKQNKQEHSDNLYWFLDVKIINLMGLAGAQYLLFSMNLYKLLWCPEMSSDYTWGHLINSSDWMMKLHGKTEWFYPRRAVNDMPHNITWSALGDDL